MKKQKQESNTARHTVTTAEIVAALGVTGQAVGQRASKGSWTIIGRARPGGLIYELDSLPAAVQLAIVKRRISKGGWRRRLAHYLHRLAWWIDGDQS